MVHPSLEHHDTVHGCFEGTFRDSTPYSFGFMFPETYEQEVRCPTKAKHEVEASATTVCNMEEGIFWDTQLFKAADGYFCSRDAEEEGENQV